MREKTTRMGVPGQAQGLPLQEVEGGTEMTTLRE